MPKDNELKERRPFFYSKIVKGQHGYDMHWYKDKGNHKDFKVQGFSGYINWYFQDKEISKYGGHVCVVFRNASSGKYPAMFHLHPEKDDRVIASSNERDVQKAVEWVIDAILAYLTPDNQ